MLQFLQLLLGLIPDFIRRWVDHILGRNVSRAEKLMEFRNEIELARIRIRDTSSDHGHFTEAYSKEREMIRNECSKIRWRITKSKRHRFNIACNQFCGVLDAEREKATQHLRGMVFLRAEGRSRDRLNDLLQTIIDCAK
jgi:hypothetical protein